MPKFIAIIIVVILFCSSGLFTYAQKRTELPIKSEAAVMLDADTGAVLYAKNPDERLYPASLTKIATAIYAIEKGDLNDIVTVSRNAAWTEGASVHLNEGERVPMKTLIQGMIINSGNDAAVAIAEHLDGSVDLFSKNLNEYLIKNIGVTETHFVNPNGLFDPNHYTTAWDLAKITNYAQKNPVFAEIFGMKEMKWTGQTWNATLVSHHLMLNGEILYSGITGGKTGYLDESRHTLATSANNGKMRLIVIEMKADRKKDGYKDTARLLDYGFSHFKHEELKEGESFKKGKKEFSTSAHTMITLPLNGKSKEVSNKGLLSVKDENGNTLQSIQLNPVKAHIKKEAAKPGLKFYKNMHLNAFYGVFGLLIAGAFIGKRRTKND